MAYLTSTSSSSSSVPTASWKYDVFLSFRGEDTRYNFVDHLHAALKQSGICVFKDDEELKIGKAISPELVKAIEESKYAVVVFSKNYANSPWCLHELAKIMDWRKMGLKVMPVFYHVDPSDIRWQKNEIAVFFQQHELHFREEMDKVNEWREAQTAAANLSGKHISDTFRVGESTYIREIVEEILHDIQPYDTDSNLVGIDSRMDALLPLLKLEETKEVRIVGIYGMGGIGKTTIAKTLFRRIRYMFECSSFVNGVRENSSNKRDLCALQDNVIRDLMPSYSLNVRDPEDGANMIRERCVHQKVLVVLDDVDDGEQLEFLCATHDSFGPGSRLIITTRNKHLLSDANETYKAEFLLMHEALELFSRHAFKRNSPPEGYAEWSCRAIQCAGYLPLAVKLLGSFFHGRKLASVWESTFNRLAKAQDAKIFETLKLSFDGLEVSEQGMFLDIACFYKGKYTWEVTKVFESCGFDPNIGISVLDEKCLITISNERIGMHDLIQEMGRQIVRVNIPNSRLWQLADIHDSLKNTQVINAIEAIVVSDKEYDAAAEYEEHSANVFEHMKNLRVLDIRGRFSSSEPTFFPDDLRWLCWREYPFASLSMTQMSRKLVGLEVVGGTIKQFWSGHKIMTNLKYLNFQQLDGLTTFPDVSLAPNIGKLYLYHCKNLVEVHESLGSHKRIWKLQIIGCEQLKRLPSKIEMDSLGFLKVNKCSSLERFPDVSPNMVYLSFVSLDHCSSIERLPSSFGHMSSLGHLSFRRYKNQEDLESLPKPSTLRAPTNSCYLKILNLSCRPMETHVFLKNLQAFSYLEYLILSGNNNLIELPTSVSKLSRLRKLILNECHQLQVLHGLPPSIQVIEANNCYSLEKIEDLLIEDDCWNHISFINCQELDNERYLDKRLQHSFHKRCGVVDGPLTIAIPGNKIPSWFKEQPGHNVALMMPPKRNNNTQIIGIVICAIFHGEWQGRGYDPLMSVHFEKDGKSIIQKEVDDCIDNNASATTSRNGNTWIGYRPCRSLRAFPSEDWSGGALLISLRQASGVKAVNCAALLMYKEDDGESNQQIKTCIARPWVTRRKMEKRSINLKKYMNRHKNEILYFD